MLKLPSCSETSLGPQRDIPHRRAEYHEEPGAKPGCGEFQAECGSSRSASMGTFSKVTNQSSAEASGAGFSTRSLAAPQEPGGGTVKSSPGYPSAGVAQPWASLVWRAMSRRLISGKLRPLD